MADKLRFHPLVESDLRAAIDWYNEISHELGDRFRAAVDGRLDDIVDHPNAFAVAFDHRQFARLKRFPYVIVFRVRDSVVHILGVFHGATDPETWRARS